MTQKGSPEQKECVVFGKERRVSGCFRDRPYPLTCDVTESRPHLCLERINVRQTQERRTEPVAGIEREDLQRFSSASIYP
jgi:hypothetical protein